MTWCMNFIPGFFTGGAHWPYWPVAICIHLMDLGDGISPCTLDAFLFTKATIHPWVEKNGWVPCPKMEVWFRSVSFLWKMGDGCRFHAFIFQGVNTKTRRFWFSIAIQQINQDLVEARSASPSASWSWSSRKISDSGSSWYKEYI